MRSLCLFFMLTGLLLAPVSAAQRQTLRIAFTSHHEQTSDIYVKALDGTTLVNLTRNQHLNFFPDWSPDGKRIVFQVQYPETARTDPKGNGHNQIYAMDADGSKQVNLTNNLAGDYYMPVWSPDGKRIAFVSSQDDSLDIYRMDADGSDLVNLTDGVGHNSEPSWSSDGKRIAFSSDRGGNRDLYIMDADGSNVVRLTTSAEGTEFSSSPSWSPDGKRIVYISGSRGNADIFIMNADGSEITRLEQTAEIEQFPRWSPDGSLILFSVYREASPYNVIYTMRPDGSNRVKVAEGFAAAWVR